MTRLSATSPSRFCGLCQARHYCLEQSPDLLVGEPARVQPVHRRRDDRLAGAKVLGELLRRCMPGDKSPRAMPQLDYAFVFKLAIDLGDRVGVDDELFGQRPDARQL